MTTRCRRISSQRCRTRRSITRKTSEKPLLALIEQSEAIGMPVPVPLATVCEVTQSDENQRSALIEAITTVKAAGYRVSKLRKPKNPKRKDRVGPTFVAKFADGVVTRMTVFTSLEKLDWGRGERLSQAAYQSRWRARERKQHLYLVNFPVAPVLPAIVSARFEQDGKVLAQRNNESTS